MNILFKSLVVSTCLIVLLPNNAIAQAKSSSLSLNNTATVASVCSISKLQDIDFGNQDINALPKLSDGSLVPWGYGKIKIVCTPGTVQVNFNSGQNPMVNSQTCALRLISSKNQYFIYSILNSSSKDIFDGRKCADSPYGSYSFDTTIRERTLNIQAGIGAVMRGNYINNQAGVYSDTLTVSVAF